MAGKRDFGRIRQLPSGRWQARYPGPDGIGRSAPRTFERKRDAADWLAEKRTELARGDWLNPDLGRVLFGEYAARWVNERDLSETTRERYDQVLRVHLLPTFGLRAFGEIREADVRSWRKERRDAGVGQATAAKAYRLLHAILHTATDDGMLRRNPCRIRRAGEEKSSERAVLSVEQVFEIADAIRPRFRCLVLLAAFTGMRFGELAALRRTELDLHAAEVRVLHSQAELRGGRLLTKDPKSAAGLRVVAIPSAVVPELRSHLSWFSEPATDGLVFVGPLGGRLLRRNFRRLWAEAVREVGLDPASVHFHDLRHTGNNLAAATGASTKELMARMGHSTMRAALIYQHATRERDRRIADGLSEQIKTARRGPAINPDGDADGHAAGTGSASGARPE
jgi:integrase